MFDTENLNEFLSRPVVIRLIIIAICATVVLFIHRIIRRTLNNTITDNDRKYKLRKMANMFAYFLIILAVLFVYGDQLGNVGVALGVAGAGIAFALQEVIVSIAGWITIMLSGSVNVGQRIKIGDVKGDIIDIGVLNTTVMEIGDWVKGDNYNGRIVTLSNSFVYKKEIHNYSAEYPFLWDELTVPIRIESDYVLARELFQRVLVEVCGEFSEQSQNTWRIMANKFRVEKAQVNPMVTLVFDENWITFTLRYVVDYQQRRSTKDKISVRLLEEIKQNQDSIRIASSAIEVSYDGQTKNSGKQ
ncbi:MAG: mechanosensitive ion channel domain-containing protein [Salibacteraceae bacterium]